MPRFTFRLQTLRRLREIHRDEVRGRLAEAYEAEQILEERRRQVAHDIVVCAESRRRAMQSGALDVNQLLATQRYELFLQAEGRTLADQAALLAEEVENRRLAVVEADRQVRVLDKLEERRRREFVDAQSRKEAKQLDEVAVTGWARRHA